MSCRLARLSVTALVAVAATAPLAAQASFEGVVTMRLSGEQRSELTYSVKGDRVRMDIAAAGMPMYVLMDPTATLMVIPARQMYMVQPPMAHVAMEKGAAAGKPDVKLTGKKETVAGYECEHILVTDDGGKQVDVCGAKGLGRFMMSSGPMGMRGGGGNLDADVLKKLGDFFPLKVQKPAGDVVLEVTKIEKKPLDESVFKIPDGYQKLDMGNLMRPPR